MLISVFQINRALVHYLCTCFAILFWSRSHMVLWCSIRLIILQVAKPCIPNIFINVSIRPKFAFIILKAWSGIVGFAFSLTKFWSGYRWDYPNGIFSAIFNSFFKTSFCKIYLISEILKLK